MSRVWPLALALALGTGCVTRPPAYGEPAPVLKDVRSEQAYQALLTRYTANDEIYSGFDTVLFAAATLQTPAFREARVRRQAIFQSLTARKVEQLLAEERAQASRTHEFLLGVHVDNPRNNDFDRPDSIWNVLLVTPTAEARPVRVRRLGRSSQDLRALYPYLGTYWVAYRLEFPTALEDGTPVIPPGTERVALRLASSLGQVELRVSAR